MRGMRARYPGFEYENYEDFCRRSPETIPDQVWIPDIPYLEDSVRTETKPVSGGENGLKTTIRERKQSMPGVQVGKDKKPSKIQQKKEKPVKKPVKKEKIHVKEKTNSKIEIKPTKRESRKKKLVANGIEEEKTVLKNKSKPGTKGAEKTKDKLTEIPGKIIEDDIVKKVPSVIKVTKIEQSTSQSL